MQLTLDEFMDENDILVESEGIKVVYNSGLEGQVRDSLIDYSNNWFERGFVIRGSRVSSC